MSSVSFLLTQALQAFTYSSLLLYLLALTFNYSSNAGPAERASDTLSLALLSSFPRAIALCLTVRYLRMAGVQSRRRVTYGSLVALRASMILNWRWCNDLASAHLLCCKVLSRSRYGSLRITSSQRHAGCRTRFFAGRILELFLGFKHPIVHFAVQCSLFFSL